MKKILIIIALLSVMFVSAQEYERFIGEAGVRIPVGSLALKIGPSPELGLWFRSRMEKNDMIDIGGSIHIPADKREFDYTAADSIYRVKAKSVSGMAGFRVSKIYTIGFNKSFEWLSTFGYAFMLYDDEEARYKHTAFPEDFEDSDNNSFTKAFSTFHIGQGVRLSMGNTGIQMNYNYVPYGLFTDYVPANFGSHSLSLSIVYRQ